jgi:hypothetical protein
MNGIKLVKFRKVKLVESIVDKKLIAEFAGNVTPAVTAPHKAKNVGNPSVEVKQPPPAAVVHGLLPAVPGHAQSLPGKRNSDSYAGIGVAGQMGRRDQITADCENDSGGSRRCPRNQARRCDRADRPETGAGATGREETVRVPKIVD